MTTRTLSLQLEEDFTTHTAALFVSHVNVFQSTIRIIAGERRSPKRCLKREVADHSDRRTGNQTKGADEE